MPQTLLTVKSTCPVRNNHFVYIISIIKCVLKQNGDKNNYNYNFFPVKCKFLNQTINFNENLESKTR